jgi:hypothetical protein
MIELEQLKIAELGAMICNALKENGLNVTLSGGACAEIYSASRYVTGDLDFVCDFYWSKNDKIIARVMSEFGFTKKGRIYIHKKVAYSVEFPPGPLGIGDEYQIKPVEIKLKTGVLTLLSPTDSVKDRLTGYFYSNDAQCLEQAIMICKMNTVDIDNIRMWSDNEGQKDKFIEFEQRLH